MNTLVMCLDSLAVTEYTAPFTGLSGEFEATAAGLFAAGGATDDGLPIASRWVFGDYADKGGRKLRATAMYLYGEGDGLKATAAGTDGKVYRYRASRHGEVSRAVLGAGLSDNYLTFGVERTGATPLSIDRIEVDTAPARTRRF